MSGIWVWDKRRTNGVAFYCISENRVAGISWQDWISRIWFEIYFKTYKEGVGYTCLESRDWDQKYIFESHYPKVVCKAMGLGETIQCMRNWRRSPRTKVYNTRHWEEEKHPQKTTNNEVALEWIGLRGGLTWHFSVHLFVCVWVFLGLITSNRGNSSSSKNRQSVFISW